MKRALGVIKKILVIIFALVLLSVMAIFTYHHYQLSNEAKLIKGQGTLVDIKNKNINVYEEGRGGRNICLYVWIRNCFACV